MKSLQYSANLILPPDFTRVSLHGLAELNEKVPVLSCCCSSGWEILFFVTFDVICHTCCGHKRSSQAETVAGIALHAQKYIEKIAIIPYSFRFFRGKSQ
jgi:hypothetical protein